MGEEREICIVPCSGRARLGIDRGHIFHVGNGKGKDLGWMSEEEAIRRFGKGNIVKSESDDLCPSCSEDIGE